jgi:DNA-binding NarL/FixJ family response regulator
MRLGEEHEMGRVVVVSARQLMRNLIRIGLQSMNGSFQQVFETCSDEETGARCVAFAPQLIMIDLTEPSAVDFRVFRELASEAATWALLVIASQSYVGILQAFARSHGFGALSTNISVKTLIHAANLVGSGGTYIDPAFRYVIRERMKGFDNIDLSRREKHVLQLIAQGYSTKEVADILKISVKTADKYRAAAMRKLNVHDVVRLTHCAIRLGLVTI